MPQPGRHLDTGRLTLTLKSRTRPHRTTLLASREKLGKSTLLAYVTAEVSNGGKIFGRPCDPDDRPIRQVEIDLNLRGQSAEPIAAELTRREIPFAFASGYEDWVIPTTYADHFWLEKPVTAKALGDLAQRIARRA